MYMKSRRPSRYIRTGVMPTSRRRAVTSGQTAVLLFVALDGGRVIHQLQHPAESLHPYCMVPIANL